MYLLLFVGLLVYASVNWINTYALIFVLLVYIPWYFDNKEYNGERRWDWLRRLYLWRFISPIEYTFANLKDLSLMNHTIRRIYVMVPGDTIMSLIWGIGLHGGQLPFAERLHYVVPPIFMWIPLLRDVLLWTGAITYHYKKRPLETVLLEMLHNNRSVCYCPSNFANMTSDDGEEDIETGSLTRTVPCLSEEMLQFALHEQIQLVPVVVHCERKRYYIFTHDFLLKRIQRFFYWYIGYPFPLFFWLKMFSRTRPPLLHQQFGAIIECNQKYASTTLLKESFKDAVEALTCRELGDDSLKLM